MYGGLQRAFFIHKKIPHDFKDRTAFWNQLAKYLISGEFQNEYVSPSNTKNLKPANTVRGR